MLKKLKEDLNGHGRSFGLGQVLTFMQIIALGGSGMYFTYGQATSAAESYIVQVADTQLVQPVKEELKMLRKSVDEANIDRSNIKKDIAEVKEEVGTVNSKLDEILNRLPASQ